MDWLYADAWVPVTPPMTGGSLCRSRDRLIEVLRQFPVESHPRYEPRPGVTFCNIFVADISRALGAEIPYWWMRSELNANSMADWLAGRHGQRHGWRISTRGECIARAELGMPCVVVWKNPDEKKPGHIAMVVPSEMHGEARIAQAGSINSLSLALTRGFGDRVVTFFTHN